MTRNLKALGLALLAAFALSAVAASAASASKDVFTSNSANEKTDLTGHSTNPILHRGSSEIICPTGTYAGTIGESEVGEVIAHPTYGPAGECEAAGGKATVHTDGCSYKLTGTTHTVGSETHATVYVECTEGHEITITVPGLGLTFHIGTQGPLSGVTYKTIETAGGGGDGEVTIKATVKGVKSTCTGGHFLCTLAGGTENTTGVYTDDVLVKGYKDEGTFTQNATTHVWSGTHGSQVDIGAKTVG